MYIHLHQLFTNYVIAFVDLHRNESLRYLEYLECL